MLVLAAGDGARLHSLTTDASGTRVPKQFCSLAGGGSLLEETLARAGAVAPARRVVCVVALRHRRWWRPALAALPAGNIVVQPSNRGTAAGILLPLLTILKRDPLARILILPSDHFVRDEAVLRSSIRRAVGLLPGLDEAVVLLGIEPEESDPELGYIAPGPENGRGAMVVSRFVEKPSPALASELLAAGGVWNSFIMAADGPRLLGLFEQKSPGLVATMLGAVRSPRPADALNRLYETLPDTDFSRGLLTGSEAQLRVLCVPRCGWSDLGTPKRVARTLERLPARCSSTLRSTPGPVLDLSAAHLRLQAIG